MDSSHDGVHLGYRHACMPVAERARTTGDGGDRNNNFDIIRIAAALQVVLYHGYRHLSLSGRSPVIDSLARLLRCFPGVPVFFVVSGFLVTRSFERTPHLGEYVRNRFLRIYPALWAVLALTLLQLAIEGVITLRNATSLPVLTWLAGQATVVQVFSPTAIRGYGIGTSNGALWTIAIELQFYTIVPLMVRAMRWGRSKGTLLLIVLWVMSAAADIAASRLDEHGLLAKVFQQTLAPWLYLFLFGVLANFHWDRLGPLFCGRFPWWLGGLLLCSSVLDGPEESHLPEYLAWGLTFAAAGLLAASTLSLAFSWPGTARRVLRGTDISYGVYLTHCLVLNVLVQHHVVGSATSLAVLVGASVLLGLLSWRLVERPALQLKARSSAASRIL